MVLDVGTHFAFREGQSLGILPPGCDANGRPHAMRLYSIASSRSGEEGRAGQLALTIKRVVTDVRGKPHRGICSNYVCDRVPGDTLLVVGPVGVNFLLPDDPATPLMMICTGTGIAPMRGMLAHRQRVAPGVVGADLLFYGARSPEEMAYSAELAAQPASRLDLNLAYSRAPGRTRQYVQDLLRASGEKVVARLRDERCHFYLCGLPSMEAGVFDALRDLCLVRGLNWSGLAAAMRHENRLHIETYGNS